MPQWLLEIIERENSLSDYDLDEDYLEMVLQVRNKKQL
jgi:hypothetical protein